MNFRLLTEQHLECLSLTGGCTGSSESTLVRMPHCWKSHVNMQHLRNACETHKILLDFSLTVKAATLIFISGRDSAISSTKEGESGFVYNLVKS